MWTQEQLVRFGQAVEALGRLVETLEGLVGNLEERLEMANGRLPGAARGPEGSFSEAWETGGGHDGE